MTDLSLDGDPADLVLSVYLDELVSDRRVLFVGDPDPSTLERLATRARTVDVVVPGGRLRGTRRGGNVRSRSWPREEDAGRWHVVVVPNLDAADLAEADGVEEARRWVRDDGVVVLAFVPPADDPVGGYEAFFDLVEPVFDEVRMLGEAPFRGRSVVDLEPRTRGQRGDLRRLPRGAERPEPLLRGLLDGSAPRRRSCRHSAAGGCASTAGRTAAGRR